MSKGLEALERLKMFPIYQEIKRIPQQFRDKESINTDLSIIEKELKEYQHHEEILNYYGLTLANFREACLLLAMLKGDGRNIHNIDKQLEALEVIKKYPNTVKRYIMNYLPQEEYDLLKEVLL